MAHKTELTSEWAGLLPKIYGSVYDRVEFNKHEA
jgi:hypothetical protein